MHELIKCFGWEAGPIKTQLFSYVIMWMTTESQLLRKMNVAIIFLIKSHDIVITVSRYKLYSQKMLRNY